MKLNVKFCIYTKRLLSVSKCHTSSTIYSDNLNPRTLESLMSVGNERLSKLQLIKYKEKVEESDMDEIISPHTSYGESFPWLTNEEGNIIDYNKTIDLFNGVKLISQYLEKRFGVNKEFISEVKITELLEIFEKKDNITVLDLFNHVGELYNKDKNSFLTDLISDSNKILVSENTADLMKFKPLGPHGDKTLNEIVESLLKLNWKVITDPATVTVHAAPVAINLISYNFMLRGYMKYVHNRPYDHYLTPIQLEVQKKIRRQNLLYFSILGAPIMLVAFKYSTIGIKNMIDISFSGGSKHNTMNEIESSSLFLLLSKINNKIPSWVKFIFNFILFGIVILKLFGYSIIDVFIDTSLLKNIVYFNISFVMSYQLLILYLVHKFSTRKVSIPKVLPDFIINWLQNFEVLASSKASITEFKKTCYIEILIYMALLCICILIF